ncbi:uncharacterized protein N7498_008776 [Penicillium cinerascens]|uniref:Rhodopsin domain-containing protein n=1 Tax=Penicillium cinerascens TaxID=70096 RepID=A0A9W9MAZ6_9EURO|nr:uncharacterized protein N7498_008776 [Penicillium cinerascens]KAJ5195338.1 hypothetical protein N7498_008776 [Penicillium cinerascens]
MTHSLQTNNLDNISLATQILGFSIVSPLVALRAFASYKLHHPFGVEDGLTRISCSSWGIPFAPYSTRTPAAQSPTCKETTLKPNTKYFPSKPLYQPNLRKQIFYIATIFYVPMVLFVKTSLIYIFIRLWSPYRGKVIALYTFLIFITLYYIIIFFVKIFTCNPVSLYWKVNRPVGSCLNRSAIIVTDSVISVITDLAILVFPIVLTWSMHMSVSKKLHVIAILGAGSIAIAFSIYRLALSISELGTDNKVVWFMKVFLSDSAEGGLGLICTCIPTINKLATEVNRKRRVRREEKRRLEVANARPSSRRSDGDSASLFLYSLPHISSQDS